MARGAGVRPEDPPLRWEASRGEGAWAEVEVLDDRTGGFNYGSGVVELQCPSGVGRGADRGSAPALAALPDRADDAPSRRARRLPARARDLPDHRRAGGRSARRRALDGRSSTSRSERAAARPARRSSCASRRCWRSSPGETLEVQTPAGDWEAVGPRRVVRRLGPRRSPLHDRPRPRRDPLRTRAARCAERGRKKARRDAAEGRRLRMSRYRHGGGRTGSVAPDSLTTLRSAIPGVASVTNPGPARGGVDTESVAGARARAALNIRTRDRAVTAQDYEFLATDRLAAGGQGRARGRRRAGRDARHPAPRRPG